MAILMINNNNCCLPSPAGDPFAFASAVAAIAMLVVRHAVRRIAVRATPQWDRQIHGLKVIVPTSHSMS